MEMKKLKILILLVVSILPLSSTEKSIHIILPEKEEEVKTVVEKLSKNTIEIEDLIKSLIKVESSGNDSAVGDQGKAIGALQIHPITVREVNRILALKGSDKRYTYVDRWSRTKSIQMFEIWRKHHHPEGTSLEVIARTWNGGTKYAFSKDATRYWKKVKNNFEVR